jgi:site-specific DNA recombinase
MNAVIYVRVSTDEQVENTSLANQASACTAYSKARGIQVDRIFREEGRSAKTAQRPELGRLLEYCERNRKVIDLLVVHRFDRLARNVEDHLAIKATLKAAGIQLVSVTEEVDDSPGGRLFEVIFAGFAQYDNDVRAERTIEGMKNALRAGRWLWKAPIGFMKPSGDLGRSLVPDPKTADLVLRAFERCASGTTTLREVWQEVTELGLERGGRALSQQQFSQMLRNPIYKGRAVSETWGIDVAGDFDPLVSDDLFSRVQEILKGCPSGGSRRVRDNPDFPLRRVVRCGSCDSPLTGSMSTSRSKKKYGYYRCHKKGCGATNVSRKVFESQFEEFLDSLEAEAGLFDLMSEIMKDALSTHVRQHAKDQKRLSEQLQQTQSRKQRLVAAYVYEERVDTSTYESERSRLDREIASLEEGIEGHCTSVADVDAALARSAALLADLSGTWRRLERRYRPQFARALFPAGMRYIDGVIGTAEKPWLFGLRGDENAQDDALAPPTGFEPVLPA